MRLIDIFKTASANMFRSKLRTALTIIAIFIGSFTLALTSGLGSGISSYIDKQVGNLGAKDVLVIMGKNIDTGLPTDGPTKYNPDKQTTSIESEGNRTVVVMTQADIDKIKQVSGIKSVEPYISVGLTYVTGANNEKFVASISQFVDGANYTLDAGEQLTNNTTEYQVLLPSTYIGPMGYESAEKAIGQTVQLAVTDAAGQTTLTPGIITGVSSKSLMAGSGLTANKPLMAKLHEVQMTGLPASATTTFQIVVAKFDPNMSDAEIAKMKNSLDKLGYTAQTVEDQIGAIKTVINAIVAVLNGFAIIALLAAGFGIINTLLMSVQERTKEIGLMKAMGMGSGRIFMLFSGEAVMLGFWGSLIGIGAAILVGTVINQIVINGFLKDLVGLKLLTFPPLSLLAIMGIVMGIAFLAGTLPALRAARQSPIDSLRYE